jgi:hypothetical protein
VTDTMETDQTEQTEPSESAEQTESAEKIAPDEPIRPDEEPSEPTGDDSARSGAKGSGIDLALGAVRLGVGAALVAAPRWAGRIWVGPGADGPGSLVFARALGARDVALGLRIIDGVRTGAPVRHWVVAGFGADAADVVATMLAGRHLEGNRRAVMPLVAASVGVAGVWSVRRAQHGR